MWQEVFFLFMVSIRSFESKDIIKAREIWERFFRNDFEFPDFFNGYLAACVVEKEGEIICVGGVRTITELVALTDKEKNVRDRVRSLKKLLEASIYFSTKTGHEHLHTFSKGDIWINQLTKAGFSPCNGTALYI